MSLDLSLSPRGIEIRERLAAFLDEVFYPVEAELDAEMDALDGPEPFGPLMIAVRKQAREAGLWNLFLADESLGHGLSNVDYGHVCELLGRSMWAPMVANCHFPDTGNMEILHQYATPEQRERWLRPLFDGEIRSCFALTEPDVASSDPTGITTSAVRDGDDWIINGHKWFISNAVGAQLCILMARTDPDAEPHLRGTMFLVPMDSPGLEIVRRVPVFGHAGGPGHAELRFHDVRVGADAVLAQPGAGFLLAQDRLGPGRIHHCMRSIGWAERAQEYAIDRAATRPHRDGVLAQSQLVREMLARNRIDIDAARLLVLRAAHAIDTLGKHKAYREISIAKAHAAQVTQDVVDRAIQIHGALGLSDDVPLTRFWAMSRALRIGDGADEVHLMTIAKHELRKRGYDRAR
ncbi:acyl-CoA dehydrogenase family protein [Nocardia sp. CDC160]|uniref:acyl-CoA dehydrogenase family protein n=1 Tax=Nocardia sp. CDC160 TaxID=3112166 RepID=UPI002DBF507E|nr:acyl-CoA dehydrogenase family protein [Nocardia sp. CDC160]MEC3919372.1 acyl-CoA dehydrogenase family protein [Nocardia sp. CDC160]